MRAQQMPERPEVGQRVGFGLATQLRVPTQCGTDPNGATDAALSGVDMSTRDGEEPGPATAAAELLGQDRTFPFDHLDGVAGLVEPVQQLGCADQLVRP